MTSPTCPLKRCWTLKAKFRAMLWSVESIQLWRDSSILEFGECRYPVATLEAAETLAHDLNAFLFHYETGNYPARQTLGLLHRSLASASKATEAVVWEHSLNARWGRHVLRMALVTQHFNDVTKLHNTSDLTWHRRGDRTYVVHPRSKISIQGTAVLVNQLALSPRFLPAIRLRARAWYWSFVGFISPVPRIWFLSYGGVRLRRHRRCENQLAALLQFALTRCRDAAKPHPSLDLSWDLPSLRRTQREEIRNERRARGRLAWLWSSRKESERRLTDLGDQ